jgi:glycosyltransferase involved in cell wall biosynthesis
MTDAGADVVLYTAVLPGYRLAFMRNVRRTLGERFHAFASDAHLDKTVRTGIPQSMFQQVSMRRFWGRYFFQWGAWRRVLASEVAVLDLNPRSLSAWILLTARRLLRRRTLVWGHLYPQHGSATRSAIVRRTMRRLAAGTLLYGYDAVLAARSELPRQPIWVVPNALYDRTEISIGDGQRDAVVYVGRLEPAKKIDLLIRAFAGSDLHKDGVRLIVVGAGAEKKMLMGLAGSLGIDGACDFIESTFDVADLRGIYDRAICSSSPGYAGLGLTQSLGFGVPVVVGDDEPHSPEIELKKTGGVYFFQSDSANALSQALRSVALSAVDDERATWSSFVAAHYSSESMAQGFCDAVLDVPQLLGPDGWPPE